MVKKEYFPLFAGIASIALFITGVGIGDLYWLGGPWWVDGFIDAVIFAMSGLSLAGLFTGFSHLFKRVFKPIIILGTILSGLTTIMCARIVYIALFYGIY